MPIPKKARERLVLETMKRYDRAQHHTLTIGELLALKRYFIGVFNAGYKRGKQSSFWEKIKR
jgi:hypothetical protein